MRLPFHQLVLHMQRPHVRGAHTWSALELAQGVDKTIARACHCRVAVRRVACFAGQRAGATDKKASTRRVDDAISDHYRTTRRWKTQRKQVSSLVMVHDICRKPTAQNRCACGGHDQSPNRCYGTRTRRPLLTQNLAST